MNKVDEEDKTDEMVNTAMDQSTFSESANYENNLSRQYTDFSFAGFNYYGEAFSSKYPHYDGNRSISQPSIASITSAVGLMKNQRRSSKISDAPSFTSQLNEVIPSGHMVKRR